MKKIFDFILFGNFVVAAGCTALIYSTSAQTTCKTPTAYYYFSFFATLFIYNSQRLFYKKYHNPQNSSSRRLWIVSHTSYIRLLIIIAAIAMAVFLFFLNYSTILLLFITGCLSIAYFLPSIRIRKYSFMKLLTLVIVWTCSTAIIPLLNNRYKINSSEFLHIGSRFFFMTAICLPFDLRDILIDKSDNIRTIAFKIGEKNTIRLSLFFLLLSEISNIILFATKTINTHTLIALSTVFVVSFVVLSKTNTKKNEYYYTGLIDGLMILEGICIFILQ